MVPLPRLALLLVLTAPSVAQTYELVWSDEFDGTLVDQSKWEFQIGDGCPDLCGWGNGELQYYRAENATVGGGLLTITAKEEAFGFSDYTSARLRTKGKADWEYGRFEMRAKLPIGKGLWPAFWMLPAQDSYGGWAASGEIDVMELVGHEPERVLGTLHYGGTFPANTYSGDHYDLASGTFNDDFHVFAVEWEAGEIRWYVDGIHYQTQTAWWSTGGPYPAPFDQPFYMLLNVAVGGDWPGPPDGSTQFPQTMVVDYVRVYEKASPGLEECELVFDDMEHGDPWANDYFVFSGTGSTGDIWPDFTEVPPAVGGTASLGASWTSGGAPGFQGGFGRTRPVDLDGATHLDLWMRADAGVDGVIELNLQDDDDGDDKIADTPDGADDEFQLVLTVGPQGSDLVAGAGWQLLSLPLSSFVDDNSYHFGGNGILDPVPVKDGGNGQLVNIVFVLISNTGGDMDLHSDLWAFTRRTGVMSGRVWSDEDGDGIDTSEPGLAGVSLELIDTVTGLVVATEVTDATGMYSFGGLAPGTLEVRVDTATLPGGVTPTYDPDGVATPHTFQRALACDEVWTEGAFGYEPGASCASSYCKGPVNGNEGDLAIDTCVVDGGPGNTLVLSSSPSALFGYPMIAAAQGSVTNPPGANGELCVGPSGVGRYNKDLRSTGGSGGYSVDIYNSVSGGGSGGIPGSAGGGALSPGDTWNFQCWNRVSGGSTFSAAFTVTFQ